MRNRVKILPMIRNTQSRQFSFFSFHTGMTAILMVLLSKPPRSFCALGGFLSRSFSPRPACSTCFCWSPTIYSFRFGTEKFQCAGVRIPGSMEKSIWNTYLMPKSPLHSRARTPRFFSVASGGRYPETADEEEEDTIYALSSGSLVGPTAVAVIRITGSKSHDVLQSLITPSQRLPPIRKAVVRTLYSPVDGTTLDQALVLLFSAPQSFTGQDVVELHCHGSRAVVQGVLQALESQIRMAERGEFTQRAFVNGKVDLLGVEALADLLAADTQKQRQLALNQLEGNLSDLYNKWRDSLVSGLAHAEAVIDFGDDEALSEEECNDYDQGQESVWSGVEAKMASLRKEMRLHLKDAHRGQLVRDGIRIAIVGPPNAGKSSLFNLLAQREAAIVSPIAGTTRDVLELNLDLGGIKCTLSDTAGVRDESTKDVIEVEGMKRARKVAEQAHITVAMVDATDAQRGMAVVKEMLQSDSNNVEQQEHERQDTTDQNNKNTMLVLNKLDLWSAGEEQQDNGTVPTALFDTLDNESVNVGDAFEISCETNQGVDGFLEALTQRVLDRVSLGATAENSLSVEGALITRERHRRHVQDAAAALERFESLAKQGYIAVDMAAEELRVAASELGRITGAVDVEDVLDVLFADFCIGK